MVNFVQKTCHVLTPVSRDGLVHMKCGMPFHANLCYMHDEYYMQHMDNYIFYI